MSDFYSAVIFLSVFIMVIMDMLVSSNDLLERELTARRAKNEHLPHVSVGYACFDPARDSVEDVTERADQMMYYYKRKLKSANN